MGLTWLRTQHLKMSKGSKSMSTAAGQVGVVQEQIGDGTERGLRVCSWVSGSLEPHPQVSVTVL